ncbi:acyl-CoA thioesterase [Sphingomonas ginkgonis]|uniref:acyl-CoA thioesterase n=1 Tax=Sphingomonas ginkgonis TaxID=2315330 RepID=UPI0023B25F45|nr:acyl-CoA thioesterase domain-containing protein [Sphingomonas ginkgonis]
MAGGSAIAGSSRARGDEPILTMIVGFHLGDRGFDHAERMPDVPPPDALEPQSRWAQRNTDRLSPEMVRRLSGPRPIDIRRIDPDVPDGTGKDSRHGLWMRAAAPLPASPLLHAAILAFMSDMGLLSSGLRPHGLDWGSPGLQGASLDHALWFHEPVAADQWLLYAMESPWGGHGRSMNQGRFFSRDGRLIASVAQEGLMRLRT